MSVRKKTLLITGLTALVALALLFLTNYVIVGRSFARLERDSARLNVRRAASALETRLSALDTIVRDWAAWDDTCAFVQGLDPGYVETNLGDVTFADLRVNLAVYADATGKIVFAKGFDFEEGEAVAIPESVRRHLSPGSPLLRHENTAGKMAGILELPEGPMLVASRPIVTSQNEGPVRGALIFARYLSSDEVDRLARETHLSLEASPWSEACLASQPRAVRSVLSEKETTAVCPLSRDAIAGYAVLPDIYGEPALLLRVVMPREIDARSRATRIYVLIALISVMLILGTANYALLEKVVLSRMARLSDGLRSISSSRDTSARVAAEGNDELSSLAADVNDMLAALQQAEAVVRRQAHYDALTDLPNRSLFEDRLGVALARARRKGHRAAILLLDLDRFKMVNDTFGHTVGDEVLKQAANRLKRCLREADTACRLGGDEFAILLPDIRQAGDAARIARRMLEVFRRPFDLEGHEMHMSASIGISMYPDDGEGARALLQKADAALYEAKQEGRNRLQFHTARLESDAQQRLGLENDLRHALERGQLALHYQPQLELATGRIVALEALLRWHHPELGVLDAGQFIAVAEEAGLIESIGEWVLREACAQARSWHGEQTPGRPPRVAVNLSGREFHIEDLTERVSASLEAAGLGREFLELEISESAVMRNVERSVAIMRELRKRRVRLTLDDFGLGHSSLIHLKQFPIDALKIDQSFVRDLARDANDQAIVEAVIVMARALGLRIIAEGVESEAQLAFLRARGCSAIQGYLCGRPVPADQVCGLLRGQGASSAASGDTPLAGRVEEAESRA